MELYGKKFRNQKNEIHPLQPLVSTKNLIHSSNTISETNPEVIIIKLTAGYDHFNPK
jgi:hypothetical protein